MDIPTKIFAAYVVATDLSTRRACGDKCSPTAWWKAAPGSKSRFPSSPCRPGCPSFPVLWKKAKGTARSSRGTGFCLQLRPFVEPTRPEGRLPHFPHLTWITPPPSPALPAKKASGNSSIFPSQSIITVSSSVHAGLAACGGGGGK